MTTEYDKLTLTHNLSGLIIPTKLYEQVYLNGTYEILSVIALYGDKIDINTTRTEGCRANGKHETKINDRALYETVCTECKNFSMEVVDETWFK